MLQKNEMRMFESRQLRGEMERKWSKEDHLTEMKKRVLKGMEEERRMRSVQ